jgi:beta-lactamase class A
MKRWFGVILVVFASNVYAQNVSQKLNAAISKLESDSQFKHGIISLYVVDRKGAILFDRNSNTGLAPASCLKVIKTTLIKQV